MPRLGQITVLGLVLATCILSACGNEHDSAKLLDYETPLAHWLNDPDTCIRKTAAAIQKSGRPWPNEVRENGKLIQYDFWLGDQLYVLPGGTPLVFNGFGPRYHPLQYSVVSGNADAYLGPKTLKEIGYVGPSHIGGTLSGDIRCTAGASRYLGGDSAAPQFSDRREAIDYWSASYRNNKERTAKVEVVDRGDIRMTEVRGYASNGGDYSSTYFPIGRDVVQTINGRRVIKPIHCYNGFDPEAPLHLATTCRLWLDLGPDGRLYFEVYQQRLPILPELHDKLLAAFEKGRLR